MALDQTALGFRFGEAYFPAVHVMNDAINLITLPDERFIFQHRLPINPRRIGPFIIISLIPAVATALAINPVITTIKINANVLGPAVGIIPTGCLNDYFAGYIVVDFIGTTGVVLVENIEL
jgi:hypothetical protein